MRVKPPTSLERRRRAITPKGRETFLAALSAGWSVQAAADRAGWHRSRFYALREADESFVAEWDAALEAGADVLEDALFIAATQGSSEERRRRGMSVSARSAWTRWNRPSGLPRSWPKRCF